MRQACFEFRVQRSEIQVRNLQSTSPCLGLLGSLIFGEGLTSVCFQKSLVNGGQRPDLFALVGYKVKRFALRDKRVVGISDDGIFEADRTAPDLADTCFYCKQVVVMSGSFVSDVPFGDDEQCTIALFHFPVGKAFRTAKLAASC